jgi:di/tricarboxylate transporter
MTPLPIVVSSVAIVVVAALFYLRRTAKRAGLHQEQEHWMVFGVFAGMIAVSGIIKENIWVSIISLLLAVFGVVYHARLIIAGVKTNRNEERA